MNYELIKFEAIDDYGNPYRGAVVVDITKDINKQVSRYLSVNVYVTNFKGLQENFYSF